MNVAGEHSSSSPHGATIDEKPILSQSVNSRGRKQCAVLFRKYVSRTAAGSGRAVLEGVGLTPATIEMCYKNSPQNEEEAIQSGLMKWMNGSGDSTTWAVLIEAMEYAQIGTQHIEAMKKELLKDLPRKRRRLSSTSSVDLDLQEPGAKKSLPDYTATKMDLLARDMSDLRSESDPEVIIKLLYGNALATISDLLKPHLKEVKKAAVRYHRLGLHHVAVGEDIIESADSINRLMSLMSVTRMWNQTRFLRKAIASIPHSAPERRVAEAILFHYDQHLVIYERATLLKDALPKGSESTEEVEASTEANELVPLKITSPEAFDSFSWEDCYILQARGLKKAYGIPEEKIICRNVEEHQTFKEWQLAYEDSIRKHGSVSVEVTQSIFVGPSAAGKSTVKHFLVHNEPKEVKTSTAALEMPEVVTKRSAMDFSSEQYAVQEGTSAWQLVSSDIMKNSLHDCIASKEYEEKNQYPIEVEAKEAENVQGEALKMKQVQSDPFALNQYPIQEGQHEAEEHDGCPLPKRLKSDFALLDQQYSQVREELGGEGGRIKLQNASFVHLLDTGGQPSFQDVLPLLLDVPCTYIQVFDASCSLYERIPVTYRPNDHTVVSLGDAECGRDMMLRSFSSMHTMAQKYSKELATFQQKDSPPPQLRIFVVGTHKDELIAQGRLDEATKEIKTFLETLKGKPYYNSIQWDSKGQQFYLINALAVNDRAYVNNLRERISSEGFLKLNVPLMWFICQEVTRCTPRKFFRLQDLEAFCRKHHFVDGENAASQFRALLQLLTLLGFYAFFDLEDVQDEANFVCTDRGVFLREVSTLLAVQFSVPKGPEMESFKETGILVFTQKCFKQLGICQEMDAQWFLKALQHLGIAAQLHSNNEDCNDCQEFFIPAVLPQSLPTQDPVASVAPLCLTYKIKAGTTSSYTFMPQGVFCRLAVELIRQGWKICRKVKSTRTLLAFNCREFNIFLKESSGYISFIPQVVEEISTIPDLHTQCVRLLDTVRDGLSLSAKAVLGSNFGSFTKLAVGFKCPCKEVDMDHLAVPSETGKALECLEKDSKQEFSNEQRIWFSSMAGVHGVELVKDTELRIWVIGERPPEPHPKPQPPQPSPSHPVPREGDGALCQEVTADNVLLNFRERFIQCVDAKAIVYGLEHANIISDGDLTEINRNPNLKQQNEILHRCLTRSCDEEALMEACDMMIAVRGNRKMNSLGRDMKCKLEGN